MPRLKEGKMETAKRQPVGSWVKVLSALQVYLSHNFLGGPRAIKLAWVINFQKGATLPFVLLLMAAFQNFSTAAWVYLALHGTYGLVWILKDRLFPDPRWETRVTYGGALMTFLLVLGPYWLFPYLLISGVLGPEHPAPSGARLAFVILLHTLGLAIMLIADSQKYFTLKTRPGLITTGIFSHIRHPNYLGEMMLYAAYAVLVGHWLPWLILAWVWGAVFFPNMYLKEASLSRYAEWESYKERTGMLFPKLNFRKRGSERG